MTSLRRRSHERLVAVCLGLFVLLPLVAVAQGSFFDSDGVRIYYRVDGEGDPVLLIHGFSANLAVNWRTPGIVNDLARDYQVISIDNRGHGQSDKPENVEAYGYKMVGDAVGLLDHLGIDSAHIVGYSMGGMIGLKMAVEYPQRVRSLVMGGMGWTRLGDDVRERYENSPERLSTPLTACYRRFWEFGVSREELENLKASTSLVVGAEDRLLQSSVEPLRQVRPDFPLIVIPEANHVNAVFRPELRTAIRTFLESASTAVPESD
jgi:pimeloyl-ACP methyl ester carboxylesterase